MAKTSGFLKCECPQCGQHIEFSVEDSGQNATCPACQREIVLRARETKPSLPKLKLISLVATVITIAGGLVAAVHLVNLKHQLDRQRTIEQEEAKEKSRKEQELTRQQNLEERQRWRQEAAQVKAEADALLASGRFECTTNAIDETVFILPKDIQTGLRAGIGIGKQGKPVLMLTAFDFTESRGERQAISGFDTVRCRIGTNVFSLKQQWSPSTVKISKSGVVQHLSWVVLGGKLGDQPAKDLFRHILNSDSPIKVEFSSSFMGGSHTFTMPDKDLQFIKDIFTIYRGWPDAVQ